MVDIIPKKQEIQLSSIILVVVVVMLVVVVGVFGFLVFLKAKTTDRLSQITEQPLYSQMIRKESLSLTELLLPT